MDQQPQPSEPDSLAKINSVVHKGKCAITGGLWLLGGLFILITVLNTPGVDPAPFVVVTIVAMAYGIWALTGIVTGRWRLLII